MKKNGDFIETILNSADGGTSLYEETIRSFLDKRILIFNSEVNDDVLENYILHILKWNKEDENIPVEKRNKIKIYISTPGGSTFSAWSMIDVIENSKTPIVGVCFDMCASAGFYIYIACHERVAFKNSAILEHDGDIAIENSSKKAKDVMAFFETMDDRLKEHVLKHTKMDSDFYDSIYETEFWFFSERGKELGVVDKIVGIDVDIEYII